MGQCDRPRGHSTRDKSKWIQGILLLSMIGTTHAISKPFINSSMPEMRPTFVVNFDISKVICQHSADPTDIHIHNMSILCNGVPDCYNNPAIHDESFPYCERKCDSTCSNRGACLYDGEKPMCYCDAGYSGPMCEIEDVNECLDKPCHLMAHCRNTMGSYDCKCLPGFKGDGYKCFDMDECSMNLASCPDHASCVNLPGTYFCNCTQGYAPIGHPLEKCVDINECELNIHTCEKDQMCQNTMGSYNCVDKCSEGYEYSNGECVDINECRFEHICDPRAECINLPGTYKCECEPGMKGDGKYCKPILDCTQDDSICDRHAVCLPFAKMCMCTGGYTGDGISCHDINECEAKENPCEGQPEKRCVNTKGGYICCNAEMDDERCIKDQGAFCAGGCGLNAVCMNKTCQCLEGFVGNANTRCIDINECESDKMCPGVGQWCVNVLGGHVCCGPDSKEPECQGVHIFKTTDGEVILHHNASQDVSFIAGGSARQVASGGEIAIVTGKGDPKKWLIKNGNLPSIHITSKDELKCTQYCPLNSECIDGFCKCSTGYGGNPLFGCEDVDECLSQPCNVTAGEWCVNTIGSFYCCNPSNATDTDCYGLEISSNKGIVVIGGTGDATNETLLAAKEKVNGGGVLSEEEHNIRNISEGLIVLTSDKVGSGETIAQLKAKKNLFGVELIDIPWEANGKRNFTFEEFSLLTTDAPVDTKTGKTNNVHIEVESHEGAKSGSAQSGGQGSGSSGSSQQSSTSVSSSSSEPRSHGVKTSNANEVPLSGKENKIHIEVESHEGKGSSQQQSSSSGSQKDGAASLSQKSESSGSGAHSGDSSSHGSEASQSSSGSGSASSHSGSSSSSKQKGSSKSSSKNKSSSKSSSSSSASASASAAAVALVGLDQLGNLQGALQGLQRNGSIAGLGNLGLGAGAGNGSAGAAQSGVFGIGGSGAQGSGSQGQVSGDSSVSGQGSGAAGNGSSGKSSGSQGQGAGSGSSGTSQGSSGESSGNRSESQVVLGHGREYKATSGGSIHVDGNGLEGIDIGNWGIEAGKIIGIGGDKAGLLKPITEETKKPTVVAITGNTEKTIVEDSDLIVATAGTTPSYGNEPTTDIGLEIRWVSAEEEANRRKANLTGKAVKAEHAESGKTEGGSLTAVTSGDGSEHAAEGGQSSQGGIIVKETRTKGQKNISESGIAVWPEKSGGKILERVGSTTLAPGETTIDVDKIGLEIKGSDLTTSAQPDLVLTWKFSPTPELTSGETESPETTLPTSPETSPSTTTVQQETPSTTWWEEAGAGSTVETTSLPSTTEKTTVPTTQSSSTTTTTNTPETTTTSEFTTISTTTQQETSTLSTVSSSEVVHINISTTQKQTSPTQKTPTTEDLVLEPLWTETSKASPSTSPVSEQTSPSTTPSTTPKPTTLSTTQKQTTTTSETPSTTVSTTQEQTTKEETKSTNPIVVVTEQPSTSPSTKAPQTPGLHIISDSKEEGEDVHGSEKIPKTSSSTTTTTSKAPETTTTKFVEPEQEQPSTTEESVPPLVVTTLEYTTRGIEITLPTKDTFSLPLSSSTVKAPIAEIAKVGNTTKCTSSDECGDDAMCERRTGACRCYPGFEGAPPQKPCKDVDECAEDLHDCHETARCYNYIGGFTCFCPMGYRKNENGVCEDINECIESHGGCCSSNGTCVNKEGSYACVCQEGFVGDGYNCLPITKKPCGDDDWTKANCPSNHICLVDSTGKTDCDTCQKGFEMINNRCTDIDECNREGLNMCDKNSICTNTPGSYACKCGNGFRGDGYMCVDVDECTRSPCHPQAECTNTPGSFKCQCIEGFVGNGISECMNPNERSCEDVQSFCGRVEHTSCLSVRLHDGSLGSVCECEPNYRYNKTTNICEDIDECKENRHNCDPSSSVCINEDGGFRCECAEGYEGAGGVCVDINECDRGLAGCHAMAMCINAPGSSGCRCMHGMSGDGVICSPMPTDNSCTPEWTRLCKLENKTCHIDEEDVPQCGGCIEGHQPINGSCQSPLCHLKAKIVEGRCVCIENYEGDGVKNCQPITTTVSISPDMRHPETTPEIAATADDSRTYVKTDQTHYATTQAPAPATTRRDPLCTATNRDNCHEYAICDVEAGVCVCQQGFQGDPYWNCTRIPDLDCVAEPSMCHEKALCDRHTKRCKCDIGYIGDGYLCQPDPQDCLVRSNICSPEAICVGRRCQCMEGFTGDGIKCVSLHQRSHNSSECDSNAHFTNGVCKCNFGFFGNGLCCVPDPMDCVHYPGICNLDATCQTSTRSCKCNEGFLGNGISCFPVRSCRTDPNICSKNGLCLPSGQCICRHGWEGDGISCTRVTMNGLLTPNIISDIPSACSNKCDVETELCIAGVCACKHGYVRKNGRCEDVDECTAVSPAPCHHLATCTNTPGSYICACPEGYAGDGKSCLQHVKVGEMAVYCEPDGMILVMGNETDSFEGRVFVKGQAENPHCSKTFSPLVHHTRPYIFKVEFQYCNVRLEEEDTFSTTVIVQKHPLFITTKADAYDLKCKYPTGSRQVKSHVNVSELATEATIVDKITAPLCKLAVSNEADQSISTAVVGEALRLRLEVSPADAFSIIPRNCFAVNIETGERYTLTDGSGCAIDERLFPEWHRVTKARTEALFRSFKWPDSSMIRFQCDCSPCAGECPEINCAARRENALRKFRFRRSRHPNDEAQQESEVEITAVKQDEIEDELLGKIIQTKRLALSPLVTMIDSARENSETPDVFIIENPENSKYLRLSMYSTIFFVLFLVLMTAFFLWLRSRRLKQREMTLQMPQIPPTKISITPESLNAF